MINVRSILCTDVNTKIAVKVREREHENNVGNKVWAVVYRNTIPIRDLTFLDISRSLNNDQP